MTDSLFSSFNKNKLVLVAPVPPVKSGIADYVLRQANYLQTYYDLLLVDDGTYTDQKHSCFPGKRISSQEFLDTPLLHQRVLYHLGNSPAHLEAFGLLRKIPGVVVLHDFFLSDVQQYEEIILLGKTQASYQELIYSHGYKPVLEAVEAGQSVNLSDYPCNLHVFEQAKQVLVHSDYVIRQAVNWYGDEIRKKLYRTGFACEPTVAQERRKCRELLDLPSDAFVVGTFGFATPAKCLETIVNAWATSSLAQHKDTLLLVAGEFLDGRYQARIERLLELREIRNIRILGYQSIENYERYLSAVDLAVQLRIKSRGETSAALLDCLSHGIPVIANNHGFVEDLPENILWKIRAQPDITELAAVFEQLFNNQNLCTSFAPNALTYLQDHFDPEKVVATLFEQIENSVQDPLQRLEQHAKSGAATVQNSSLVNKQLLIDITAVARFDLRTGIQRVVRALLRELIIDPLPGYRVLPIYLDGHGDYRYAHQFMMTTLNLDQQSLADEKVSVNQGDIYLGVDLHTTSMVSNAGTYAEWHKQGVRIVNVVYDLLPVHAPHWFPAMVEPDFKAWLNHIVSQSDQVIAISRTVADDITRWVDEKRVKETRATDLRIGWFHLGADVESTVPSKGMPPNADSKLQKLATAPSFLMVGTIEPRKGHAQTLDAFEVLWAQGYQYNLVIVGKVGWQMQPFIERLQEHPELNRRLHWLEAISDEYLEKIYPCCTALIAASEGEGFGLPLIEAARHKIPVLARDIEIFREVGGDGAYFFKAASAELFAKEIQAWVNLPNASKPDVGLIETLTWQESASQLKTILSSGF